MKVLLASINCPKTEIDKNFDVHERLTVEAASNNCDIVVFPEMSLTGYIDPAVHSEYELSTDSKKVNDLVELTRTYSVLQKRIQTVDRLYLKSTRVMERCQESTVREI